MGSRRQAEPAAHRRFRGRLQREVQEVGLVRIQIHRGALVVAMDAVPVPAEVSGVAAATRHVDRGEVLKARQLSIARLVPDRRSAGIAATSAGGSSVSTRSGNRTSARSICRRIHPGRNSHARRSRQPRRRARRQAPWHIRCRKLQGRGRTGVAGRISSFLRAARGDRYASDAGQQGRAPPTAYLKPTPRSGCGLGPQHPRVGISRANQDPANLTWSVTHVPGLLIGGQEW